ncbi:MAG: DUF5939 domain-containing protein [Spirochaetales bacterium]
MNRSALDQKIRALKLYPRLPAAEVDKLGALLPTLGAWDLVRINPLVFAQRFGFDPDVLLDLFIHGAKIGLLDFHFGQICASCGGVEHQHTRLDAIHSDQIHCTVCSMTREAAMDDFIEVSFELSESLGVGRPDPLSGLEAYIRSYRSANLKSPNLDELGAGQTMMGFLAIQPDEKGKLNANLEAGLYRLMNFESHSQLEITVEGAPVGLEQLVDVDLLTGGFSPAAITLRPGRVVFHVSNRFRAATGVVLQNGSMFWAIAMPHRGAERRWHPFLTGKAFLNNQSFRELFRIQAWAPDMKLKIKNLTILFTDLKGSTDMYGRVGDINAYDVVQKHFDLLTEVVRAHHGAMVKTMGDAIMATFSNSQEGVLAALAMVERVHELNRSQSNELGLKVGVHEGAALAVNADERLDYFGQNINLAARVQGLAEAGEVWVTEAVFDSPGVAEVITASRLRSETKMATLKGISAPTTVYRLYA